ncbi:uncharacterized protein At2g27730, mitochondrial-like [Salvia hispanica]|uniref:uncharacterized protein At2g27730, mitochondrial-like n=1 Tax=Salvia hispanica TaxID=49212 RepID=UPI00200920EF|nr:uncharacterized protein At2g27730, mitochondrial-like [Salvia hispanica]XP_047969585.1 uncharacterized protein At2g27730, mitochondrial-like [Salvia hispanica]
MATRMAARYISRRLSSSGKVLSEEEKAAENIYIKKMEQEKLEKLAQKGPASGSVADAKPSGGSSSSGTSETPNVSTDKHRNYGVVVGIGTALAAVGWYLGSRKKAVEVQD